MGRRIRSRRGIKIGGVDVGGRNADSARKIIKNQVVAPLRQPVVVAYGGKDYTLSPKQLHESADVDGMVQGGDRPQPAGQHPGRVSRYATGGDVSADLEPRIRYDKSAVKDFVNQLAARSIRIPSTPRSSRAAAGCSRRRASRARRLT